MGILNGILSGVEQNTADGLVLGPISISYDAKRNEPARREAFKRVKLG